jgi:glycosyltransferase involved in cell wall biosynthesis
MTSPQTLRVLMLCPQYRPVLGGYERAAERLSIGLAMQGHAVTVVTERKNRSWPPWEMLDGVDVRRLWCLPYRGVQTMSALWSLAWFLAMRGRRYDVWHAHQYGIRTAIAIAIGKIVGRPVVLKLTSTGRFGLAESLDRERFHHFVRARHCEVDAVVAITRETRDEALQFGIAPERIHLFGNAVDTADFRPTAGDDKRSARKAMGLDAVGVVLYVGRLIPQKNPQALLLAWARARCELPGWQLHMLGDGHMAAELREMIDRLRIESCTFLHGAQRNVPAWLAASDVYAMPSILEGLSNSLLEAMASSLPTVCTEVSGVDELIAEPGAGIVVAQGDIDGFAQAIVKLASDSGLRHKMGTIARHVVEERFSIDVVAGQHARLYARLIAEKHSGASRPPS